MKRGCYQTKLKAKGKGKGNTTSGNPFGRDGKTLSCTLCASPDHVLRECPDNPDNKGKGAHVADEDNDDWQEWQGDWHVPTTSWFAIAEDPNEE